MRLYERIQWDDIKKYGSRVIIIDKDHPVSVKKLDVDKETRHELLSVDEYVVHSRNNYGPNGSVTIYNIVDRAVDDKGNLILFTESQYITYQR